NYMRITVVILISNAIILSALQFPYRPLTLNSLGNIIHQGLLSLLTTSPPNDISKLIRSLYIPITLLFAVVKIDLKEQQEYCPTAEHHYLEEANSNATESYVVEEK